MWKRHRRYAGDGTWDRVLGQVLAEADAAGLVDWSVSVDTTIARAHQHATSTARPEQGAGADDKNLPLAEICVSRIGGGRPRTRPDAVLTDGAYTTRPIWAELRRRGIRAVIPGKSDQIAARKRRGSKCSRPPGLDKEACKGSNVVEHYFALAPLVPCRRSDLGH